MTITVNGEAHAVGPGTSVDDLIVELGLAGAICATEVNREIIGRSDRNKRTLCEGDVVEIVTMVGGG